MKKIEFYQLSNRSLKNPSSLRIPDTKQLYKENSPGGNDGLVKR